MKQHKGDPFIGHNIMFMTASKFDNKFSVSYSFTLWVFLLSNYKCQHPEYKKNMQQHDWFTVYHILIQKH